MKKEDIVKAAIHIIADRGLAGFSMKMILDEVDCSEALIYKYFPTKDALMEGCFDYLASLDDIMYDESLPAAIAGETDPLQIAKKAFRTLIIHHQTYSNETRFYLGMNHFPEYEHLVKKYLEHARERHFVDMFEGTALEPRMKDAADLMSDELFHEYLGVIILNPLLMVKEDKKDDPRVVDMIVDMLFDGIDSISVRAKTGSSA